ncbi:DUF4468 domain-containing protein [Dysgonomonas sp. OttesenSCG-928-M03]|nr:DUF4468 domain-containing protein [Dysgonomonas sp. OttesenSCG-928-M03]
MKKYLAVFLCLVIPFLAKAQQNNNKYLEGAVPEVNGKVLFTKTIPVNNKISDDRLYSLMEKWAQDNYSGKDGINSRVLLSNANAGNIACAGEKYLVFQSSALSLDRAKIQYQLIIETRDNKCDVTVRNIRYDYSDSKEPLVAEEIITDKYALNKNKDKLNRYYDKFRIHTVDTVNSIFRSIDIYLNGMNTTGVAASAVQQPAVVNNPTPVAPAIPVTQSEQSVATVATASVQAAQAVVAVADIPTTSSSEITMQGYRSVTPDKIPGNIIKLLSDAMLITSGTADQTNVMAASWGGLGRFWEKPVAFCFLNPTRYSVQTMDKGDTYTLSFYTEAYRDAVQYCGSVSGRNTDKIKGSGLTPIKTPSGATSFSEAWLIIECKKLVAQPISPSAVVAKDLPSDWSKNGYHKMYIGEILNVWVK